VDKESQTEYNIKTLLRKVRHEYATVGYFMDVLSIEHSILSKWKGFSKWYANALLYHGFSKEEQEAREINCQNKNRSLKVADTEVQNYFFKLESFATRFTHQSRYTTLGNKKIVYQGYKLTPSVYILEYQNLYDLIFALRFVGNSGGPIMDIENFHLKFNIAMGVFPGNITFEPDAMIKNFITSSFIKYHYRRFEVKFNLTDFLQFNIGTIDKGLFEKFKTHGMNISIIIGGSDFEQSSWPTNFKALHEMRGYEINCKSTTPFGLNDSYSATELYENEIEEGYYFLLADLFTTNLQLI